MGSNQTPGTQVDPHTSFGTSGSTYPDLGALGDAVRHDNCNQRNEHGRCLGSWPNVNDIVHMRFIPYAVPALYVLHGCVKRRIDPEDLEKHRLVYQYFGTFTRCLFTMFELTLANWAPVARILAEEISEWFMGILVIHKLLIGVAVVGVINGVILQEPFKVAHTDDTLMMRQKSREKRRLLSKMNDLFDSLDFDKSDALDYEEFLIIADHQEV